MRLVVRANSRAVGNLISRELVLAGHTVLRISDESGWWSSESADYAHQSLGEWEKYAQDYHAFLLFTVPSNCKAKFSRRRFQKEQELVADFRNSARNLEIPRFIVFSNFQDFLSRRDSRGHRRSCSPHFLEQAALGKDVERVYVGRIYSNRKNMQLTVAPRLPRSFGLSHNPLLSWLRPTTSVDHIVNYLKSSGDDSSAQERILGDQKSKHFAYRIWRGLLDSAFVTSVLLIVPLIIVMWFGVIFESGRPGLFLQERLGSAGSVFQCVKLRTMRNGTPSAATHKVPGGSVTRLGRVLRRFKLDELPQAWNILRREMSLVGPRPCLPTQREVILARDKQGVLEHRPGLTGWAQANGVDMREPELVARYDQEYARFQSAWFDLVILARTILPKHAKSR